MNYYVDITTCENSEYDMWYICRKKDKKTIQWGYAKTAEELYLVTSYWLATFTAREQNILPPIYFLWFSSIEGEQYQKQYLAEIGISENDLLNVLNNT